MKRPLLFLVVSLCVLALILRFGLKPLSEALGYQTKAGLKVSSVPEATVIIDGVEVGKTPYNNENLKVGEVDLKLMTEPWEKEAPAVWQGKVRLNGGTFSTVNRELGATIASSSGEVLVLNSGSGVVITSNPEGADIEIDGKTVGKTPLSLSTLPSGEHTFLLSHEHYLKRSIRALLPKNFSLHLNVDLAIVEMNLNNLPSFIGSETNLSKEIKLVVKKTPTGFLRVRDKPSVKGREVGRVVPGEVLEKIEEEKGGWIKIKSEAGVEGYVSALYISPQ